VKLIKGIFDEANSSKMPFTVPKTLAYPKSHKQEKSCRMSKVRKQAVARIFKNDQFE